ncbi:nuclear transport factor 2 family protein [Azospirillum picis]|uniref:Ketosteroid isomerase-like protein n=1 Tax=Azospirillum picis TaxID=488438 RepID=A0ABU0MRP3_9PROT|nr:nuclear transport factor 2 family protein [Azospirillum picis]MBP2300882.1 ketosteroid isomerase-like protein [Azospirillum picis]MDQ0536140.1 ketosteroid isomerase-like protein [Azospirillum picis]
MIVEQYIAGWRAQDTNAILETLTRDCVVIESFGPIYRGHASVERWVATWIAEDGRVLDWKIRDLQSLRDLEIAEWTFHYTLRGEERTFDGATIAKLCGGKISYLREYATTAALYDWQGEWKTI